MITVPIQAQQQQLYIATAQATLVKIGGDYTDNALIKALVHLAWNLLEECVVLPRELIEIFKMHVVILHI